MALTSGMRAASSKPESTSCCLTVLMIVASPIVTVPRSIVTALSPSPVSAATSDEWAWRFASIQAFSKASDRTNSWILSDTKLRTPSASGRADATSSAAARSGRPWAVSADTSSSVAASMSM